MHTKTLLFSYASGGLCMLIVIVSILEKIAIAVYAKLSKFICENSTNHTFFKHDFGHSFLIHEI